MILKMILKSGKKENKTEIIYKIKASNLEALILF